MEALATGETCWLCGLSTGKNKRYAVRAWREDTLVEDVEVCHRCYVKVQEAGEVTTRRHGESYTVRINAAAAKGRSRKRAKGPAPGDDEPTA